jgi:uncharacterized membrane protein YraQ (UPF0718 family)
VSKSGAAFLKKYTGTLLFALFLLVSACKPFPAGIEIGAIFLRFLLEMAFFLPLLFILIGLFDVWVPREQIERHIGSGSGWTGMAWVILLATLQAGPLYASFPIAAMLWKKGCSARNIFIYLGAFSTLKLPMLAFEISFMGLKFSLLRTLFSLPIFIGIAFLLAAYAKNRAFSVREPE